MTEPERLYVTDRLTVRRVTQDDLSAMFAVYSDAEAMRWVDDGEPIDLPSCERWIEVTRRNYATRGYGMSALVLEATGEVIGFCGVVHPGGQAEPEIKYALLRDHWGKGIATEAVRGMLDYVARAFGIHEIIATVDPENEASGRVLAKAGLVLLKHRRNDDGTITDVFGTNGSQGTC